MLSVITLNAVMLIVIMLNVVTLNVVMLNVVMLNVVVVNVIMLNVVMLNVIILNVVYAKCRQLALYAECRFAGCQYAEFRCTVLLTQLRVILSSVGSPMPTCKLFYCFAASFHQPFVFSNAIYY